MSEFSQEIAELIVDYVGEAPWVPKPNLRWSRISISTQISREEYIEILRYPRWPNLRTREDDWIDLLKEMHTKGLCGIKSHFNWIEGVSMFTSAYDT